MTGEEQELGSDLMRFLEKNFMLQVIDHHWKDHLLGMDHLRDGIGLRGYGQKDPLIEYKREGYDLFAGMMERVKSDALDRLFHVQAVRNEGSNAAAPPPPPVISRPQPTLTLNRGEDAGRPSDRAASDDKVGRNDPCPCGAGKNTRSATEPSRITTGHTPTNFSRNSSAGNRETRFKRIAFLTDFTLT